MSSWRERRVFVTGATGLLGSWLTEELLARGARVVCLVRDWIPASRLIDEGLARRADLVRGDLADLALLTRALNEHEIDTIFHLGAQTIVGTALRSPLSTFETNIRGTWNLLEAAKTCAKLVRRVVVASSDKAYGAHNRLPYTEETPLAGRAPYDVSKSCADLIALSYHGTYGVPVAVTRCGNLYGGGDLNFNRLIPGTIRSVLENQAPIIRSDGTMVRDYLYVRDAVRGYLALADRLVEENLAGQAFNLGTGEPASVLEVVRRILRLLERADLAPVILGEASHEIPNQTLDSSRAERVLGWRPGYTLDAGLKETIAWYRRWLERRGRQPADFPDPVSLSGNAATVGGQRP